MKAARHNKGFSLIEVMVAILILGVALVGLVHGINTALGANKESELQTVAALFAQGKIEQLRAEGTFENGEDEGDCGSMLKLYRWKQTVTDAGIDGLHEVDVVVTHAQTQQEIYELKTLLFHLDDASSTNSQAGAGKSSSPRNRRNRQP